MMTFEGRALSSGDFKPTTLHYDLSRSFLEFLKQRTSKIHRINRVSNSYV